MVGKDCWGGQDFRKSSLELAAYSTKRERVKKEAWEEKCY